MFKSYLLTGMISALLATGSGCAWFRSFFESEPLEREGGKTAASSKSDDAGSDNSFFWITSPERRDGLDKETSSALSDEENAVVKEAIDSSYRRDPEVEMLRRRNAEGREERRRDVFGF